MRNFLLLLSMFGFISYLHSQNVNTIHEEIFTVVEEPPRFSEGRDAHALYIFKNLQYPADKREGDVILKFVINENGDVSNIIVLRSIAESYDSEAISLSPSVRKSCRVVLNEARVSLVAK